MRFCGFSWLPESPAIYRLFGRSGTVPLPSASVASSDTFVTPDAVTNSARQQLHVGDVRIAAEPDEHVYSLHQS
jgi:hypothetical protein